MCSSTLAAKNVSFGESLAEENEQPEIIVQSLCIVAKQIVKGFL